ncbi:streptogramin A resistance protein [Secundilactobacillus odoratitofui DSM 19909 = JCM 15043]|uniref:Streptogramin A resistance protein n=1 Tax=Secundilactobacillus odoratitofui DSM 19909 = JCM 15043 TaxID=1423776 RepID=A0A0R1M2H0_9LACO|nr:CatB-related O-acetyltransferase [Secundilactobacillus odoratitofui]KRK98626.1 streptogramin A resistance protein [Secundilactobacillus odoratitofui DSM 19909 = JCM 15043]
MTVLTQSFKADNLFVGRYTFYDGSDFETDCVRYNVPGHGNLKIGSFCSIAANVQFMMGASNHSMNSFSTYAFGVVNSDWGQRLGMTKADMPVKGDTVIGNDVWIGRGAVIMPGVHIGDGAVIGAYSLVTKDVAPYTIVGGNPAHVIRTRFDETMVAFLERFQWWQLSDELLPLVIPYVSDVNQERALMGLRRFAREHQLAS